MSVHSRLLFRSLLGAVVDSFVLVRKPTCGKLIENANSSRTETFSLIIHVKEMIEKS